MGKKNQDYDAFVEKFKPKHTTDDCFTPPLIYNTVQEWLLEEGLIKEGDLIFRPFWPGKDYQQEEYPEGCVVVDNPPFSIFAKIVDWYVERGIRFFLFAPNMTSIRKNATYVGVSVTVTYENGAMVGTSFVTNLYPGNPIAVTAPALLEKLTEAEKAQQKEKKKQLTKLSYPDCVLRATNLQTMSRAGVEFRVERGAGVVVSQSCVNKRGEFGSSILLSPRKTAERLAAERLAAKRLAAERLELTETSKRLVSELND